MLVRVGPWVLGTQTKPFVISAKVVRAGMACGWGPACMQKLAPSRVEAGVVDAVCQSTLLQGPIGICERNGPSAVIRNGEDGSWSESSGSSGREALRRTTLAGPRGRFPRGRLLHYSSSSSCPRGITHLVTVANQAKTRHDQVARRRVGMESMMQCLVRHEMSRPGSKDTHEPDGSTT